ncbi:hypothetical protein [Methyloceanibacter sp.]|uniref:hypothetical protein n=1 Tax=Methyloceanibacter sp. TaxID=1965321 RepID=UPI003D6D2762
MANTKEGEPKRKGRSQKATTARPKKARSKTVPSPGREPSVELGDTGAFKPGAGTSNHVFTGMIKRTEEDDPIVFALPGESSRWVKIPTNQIAHMLFVSMIRCDGQSYQLVQVFLEDPTSEAATTFADLADLYSAALAAPVPMPESPAPEVKGEVNMMARRASPTSWPGPGRGPTPCHWDWKLRRWIC